MSEDYGIVHYKNFNGTGNASNLLTLIRDCIVNAQSTNDYYWEIDNDISTNPTTQLALRARQQNFAAPPSNGNPNNQRIAIRAVPGTARLEFAYAPEGWGLSSPTSFDNLSTTPNTWTNFKNITGGTVKNGYIPEIGANNRTVWVVQYRRSGLYPASTLTFLIGNSATDQFNWGAHIGRGILPDNSSDFDLGLFGDCMMIGRISTGQSGWIYSNTSNTDYRQNSSILRTGLTSWHYSLIVDDPITQNRLLLLNRIENKFKMLPYIVSGLSRMFPTFLSAGAAAPSACGIVGNLSYIRCGKVENNTVQIARSKTILSKQQWKPIKTNATTATAAQYILWGPENLVP